MKLADALAAVEAGERVTCNVLPIGTVVKREASGWGFTGPRVVWEGTGAGHNFTARPEHEAADWRKVEGWA